MHDEARRLLEGWGMPRPSSERGTRLHRRLTDEHRDGGLRGMLGLIVLVLFLPLLLVLGVVVVVIGVVATVVSLLVPPWRRRMIGKWIGFRRPIHVEFDRDPVCPGDEVTCAIIHEKGGPLDGLSVSIRCTEHVSYRQGTSTVTASHEVSDDVVHVDDDPRPVMPRESREFTFEMPLDSMHSFKVSNNEVRWEVVVRRRFRPGIEHERAVLFMVYPGHVFDRVGSLLTEVTA